MPHHLSKKIITLLIFLFIPFSLLAKHSKQELAYQATQVLFVLDKSVFRNSIERSGALAEKEAPTQLQLTQLQAKDFKEKFEVALYRNLFEIMSQARAEILSEKEMRALIAFYKNPLGQSLIKKYPLVWSLSKVEPEDVIVKRILTKEEIEYSRRFNESDIGKKICAKNNLMETAVINKIKASIYSVTLDFTRNYLNEIH